MRYVLAFAVIFFIIFKCRAQHPAHWIATADKIVNTKSVNVILHVTVDKDWWIYFPNDYPKVTAGRWRSKGKLISGSIYSSSNSYTEECGTTYTDTIEIEGVYELPRRIKRNISISCPYTLINSRTNRATNHAITIKLEMRQHKRKCIVDTFAITPQCRCGSEFNHN